MLWYGAYGWGYGEAPETTLPDERTVTVDADDRTVEVAVEDRTVEAT